MRILMLNNEFPPLGGGTGTVNKALLQRFARVPGLEIDLVTSALGKQYEAEAFAEHIQTMRVPVDNRNLHHSSNRELLVYAFRALRFAHGLHRNRPYDFCFAWSAVPAGGVALMLRQLTGLPYLVRVCGPDIPGFERRYSTLYPAISPIIQSIWRGARLVVAKCQHEAEMISAVDHRVNISLVPNGVDLDAFHPGEPIPDSCPLRILCVGRLIERKGQHHLIRAIRQLTDQRVQVLLELVGTGDAQAADEALAKDLGVAGLVHFAGYVPREEMAAHYAAAHVFALPSYNEGMSVATLEAMASGMPIIITRSGATGLVEDGLNGLLFDWSDVHMLTAHVARLDADRRLARQMGAASRTRAACYTWDTAASRYIGLFSRVADSHVAAWPAYEPNRARD